MPVTTKIMPTLTLIASLFVRLDEEEYGRLLHSGAAAQLEAWASLSARDGVAHSDMQSRVLLPGWDVRVSLQNEVLTPGMPLSALPVESLYKPWSTVLGSAYAAQRGLYLGDAAQHIQALCASLELHIPEGFEATPDHITLLIDLLRVFLENGNERAACEFIADHFDWLGLYGAALARRAVEVSQASGLEEARRAALLAGLAHLGALTVLIDWITGAYQGEGSVGRVQFDTNGLLTC